MSRFYVGDIVKLKKSSEFYKLRTPKDPIDIDGTIYKFVGTGIFNFRVEWDNGMVNRYRNSDLEPSIVNNKLNRRLYPNYVEKNGYLNPPQNKSENKEKNHLQLTQDYSKINKRKKKTIEKENL